MGAKLRGPVVAWGSIYSDQDIDPAWLARVGLDRAVRSKLIARSGHQPSARRATGSESLSWSEYWSELQN
jgi:hypothetical protein